LALAAFLYVHDTGSPLLLVGLALAAAGVAVSDRAPSFTVVWLLCLLGLSAATNPTELSFLAIFMLLPCVAHTRASIVPAAIVVAIFAAGLIVQTFLTPELMYYGARASRPMLNPNNAAEVLNFLMVPVLCLLVDRPTRWRALAGLLLLAAMLCTGSKSGIVAALIAVAFFAFFRKPALRLPLAALAGAAVAVIAIWEPARQSLASRFVIWDKVAGLIGQGDGIGSFYTLYRPLMTDADREVSAGFFAHNDVLQIAIEMGWPAALVFLGTLIYGICTVRRAPLAASTMLAIFLHAMVSFPFYMAPASLLAGLAFSRMSNGHKPDILR
jgi:O-antigen ligase